jgi:uncharacterized membrane protein YhaH (DUF805 family)
LLGITFVIGNFVCWPIFFVIGMALALWQTRHAWFPFGRRVGRKHFWTAIGLYLSLGGLALLSVWGLAQGGDLSPLASLAVYGVIGSATASSAVTVAVGRLRDRNMSGWWVLLYYGLPVAMITFVASGALPSVDVALGEFAIAIFVLWAVFALGCWRSTAGPNRFGPEESFGHSAPRRRATAPAAREHR